MNNFKTILWGIVLVIIGVIIGLNTLDITNIDISELISVVLEREGYETKVFNDGNKAYQDIQNNSLRKTA